MAMVNVASEMVQAKVMTLQWQSISVLRPFYVNSILGTVECFK